MANVTLSLEEYHALMRLVESERESEGAHEEAVVMKKTRKASAYNKRYAKNFKKIQGRYKKKDGSWKQNGFKNCQKEAHRLS